MGLTGSVEAWPTCAGQAAELSQRGAQVLPRAPGNPLLLFEELGPLGVLLVEAVAPGRPPACQVCLSTVGTGAARLPLLK